MAGGGVGVVGAAGTGGRRAGTGPGMGNGLGAVLVEAHATERMDKANAPHLMPNPPSLLGIVANCIELPAPRTVIGR